jgi:hypothetical protein
MKGLISIVSSLLVLSGCAYQLSAMPRDSGKLYQGTATNNQMGGGDVTLTIEDVTYSGKWARTSSNDSYTILTTQSRTNRGGTVTGTGFGQTYGAGGTGKAMLSSSTGKGMRCEFSGGGFGAGGGICIDDSGRVFDLQFSYK